MKLIIISQLFILFAIPLSAEVFGTKSNPIQAYKIADDQYLCVPQSKVEKSYLAGKEVMSFRTNPPTCVTALNCYRCCVGDSKFVSEKECTQIWRNWKKGKDCDCK